MHGDDFTTLGSDTDVDWYENRLKESFEIKICGRSGLGKRRCVQTKTRWIQKRARTVAIQLRTVSGLVNPAGLFTKHHLSSRDTLNQLVELFNCEYRDGRTSTAPLLTKETAPKSDGHVASFDHEDDNNHGPAHDPDIVLHNYTDGDLNALFP